MARTPKPSGKDKRNKAKREPYDKVLLVCEDSKSTPDYFQLVCDALKLNTANIKIIGEECDSAPISVVDYAIEEAKAAKKAKDTYDSVICIIDRDTHPTYQEALIKAKSNQCLVAASFPCFEYWLLLHFRYSTKQFVSKAKKSPCYQMERELKQDLPSYEKSDISKQVYDELLKPKQVEAISNAHKIEAFHLKDSESDWNPSTQLHKVIEYLSAIKSESPQKLGFEQHKLLMRLCLVSK